MGVGSLGGSEGGRGDWLVSAVGRKVCCEWVSTSLAGSGSSVFAGVVAAEGASGLAMVSFPRVIGVSMSTDIDERVSAMCALVRGTEEPTDVSGSVVAGEVMVPLLCLFFSGEEVEVLADFLSVGSVTWDCDRLSAWKLVRFTEITGSDFRMTLNLRTIRPRMLPLFSFFSPWVVCDRESGRYVNDGRELLVELRLDNCFFSVGGLSLGGAAVKEDCG